jgi:hypothetical protein
MVSIFSVFKSIFINSFYNNNFAMVKMFKHSAFLLIAALTLSCNHPQKVKVAETKPDSTVVTPQNNITDDRASFISGMPVTSSECLAKLDSTVKWKHYSKDLDSMFSHATSMRIEKMKVWADAELIRNKEIKTVFYPFSGPDFLNANIFYPNADQYIMIAMEPIGSLPDFCKMPVDSVKSYLNSLSNAMKDIFKRSYFITLKMSNDLSKTKANGTVPLISLFIKRTGHQIISIQRIGIDSTGTWHNTDSLKNEKNIVQGVKIDFRLLSGGKVQSVFYFRTDISDKGLLKNNGFRNYLAGLPQSYTYLKAASYLMHSDNFKMIRSSIFDKSSTILQDDSGIAYRYFEKSKWNLKLYGKYSKPKDEFSYIKEPDLAKAFQSSDVKPLTYSLGYNWGTDHTSILYAIKK